MLNGDKNKVCKKLPYSNPRIDSCLQDEIIEINRSIDMKTIASCCGHGKYPKSIIIIFFHSHRVFELFSEVFLGLRKRKGNRYYKKDAKGFYFIPEVIA